MKFSSLLESIKMLLEDRVDFLKQQFKDKLPTDHDELAKHTDSDKIIDHFTSKADPTTNKVHSQWLLNQYKNKSIRQEDAPQLKRTLQDFELIKPNLEKKDINQYKDVGELRDAVATQKATVEKSSKEKKSAVERKGEELEKMYDADGVTGYKIPNKECSVSKYGPGGSVASTHWCTAANSENNMFNNYKGGKYTMHLPNGEVLQFHHQSNQVKDKNDVEIQPGDPRFAPYEHHIDKFIRQTMYNENGDDSQIKDKFHTHSPEEVDAELDKAEEYWKKRPDGYVHDNKPTITDIAKKAALTDEQYNRIKALPKGDYRAASHKFFNENPKLTHEQVKKELDAAEGDEDKTWSSTFDKLSKNPAVKNENIDRLYDNLKKHQLSRFNLAKNPNLHSHHIDKLVGENDKHIDEVLAANHGISLSKEHQKRILDSDKGEERDATDNLAKRKDLHPDVMGDIINNGTARHHKTLLDNTNIILSPDHIKTMLHKHNSENAHHIFSAPHEGANPHREDAFNKLIENAKESSSNLARAIISKFAKKEHINRVLDEAEKSDGKRAIPFLSAIAGSPKLSDAHLDRILNHPQVDTVSSSLAVHPKMKPEHLKKLIDNVKTPSNYFMGKIYEHKNTNGDVLHKLYDNLKPSGRQHILHHPAVQLSHFQKAMNEGPRMHGAITSSPSAPPSMLAKLADSDYTHVRKNIAKNKNTDAETLKKLSSDSDTEVSEAAKKRIK